MASSALTPVATPHLPATDGVEEEHNQDKHGPWSRTRYDTSRKINGFNQNDYYMILNLEKNCKIDEIKEHYKILARMLHPDKSKWEDSKTAFQRVSIAYSVLKDPKKRSSYDKTEPGKYVAGPVDADVLFGEDFSPNAFGDDSGSEEGEDHRRNETQDMLKPNEAHKSIYKDATKFIQEVLQNPPMTKEDKEACKGKVAAFNLKIKEQNQADGLKGTDLGKFYIQYTIFETNAILAKPSLDILRGNREDSAAKENLQKYEDALRIAIKDNEYEDSWCYEALGFISTKEQKDDVHMGGVGNQTPGQQEGTERPAPGTQEGSIVKWKPGYTLTGEKIIAVIPKERTIHPMIKGVRGPAEKFVFSYQFIVLDEKEALIELVSGSELGNKAKNGYLNLPEDKIVDARYSEDRYTQEDAEWFDKLIDFTAKPFQSRSSDTPRHPNGYGLASFKNGREDVMSRTALRKMLGQTDADFEIQECLKRNGKIPAWKIQPLGWRQPKSMEIKAPKDRRLFRERRVVNEDDTDSEGDGLFVPNRGRGGYPGKPKSDSVSPLGEIEEMRNEMLELKAMLKMLMLKEK
jgi:hypothetical protein